MGSTVEVSGSTVKFFASISDNEPVLKLQLISNGGTVVSEFIPEDETISTTWEPEITVNSGRYYFLKVFSEDILDDDGPEQIAVTAPIWIK